MPDSSQKPPLLSVVVPCYNERSTVGELLRHVIEVPIEKEDHRRRRQVDQWLCRRLGRARETVSGDPPRDRRSDRRSC
jgi:hypothetical protein